MYLSENKLQNIFEMLPQSLENKASTILKGRVKIKYDTKK